MNKYLKAVADMDTTSLDNWYEDHVGYRISEDDSSLVGSLEHGYAIAEMMCLHDNGEGEEYSTLYDEIQSLRNN